MYDQGLITTSELRDAQRQSLPPRDQIRTPKKVSRSPYFTSWVEDQLVDRYGSGNTFGGGLEIRTTLDLEFQEAAEQAIAGRLGGIGPSAALVAIDNDTGGVRAMVGGSDFEKRPFNLATQGHRQPGSAFKPFTLVAALEKGISPGRTFSSAPKTLEGSARAVQGGELRGPLCRCDFARRRHDGVGQRGLRRGGLPARRHAGDRAGRAGRWEFAPPSRGIPRWCWAG